jgi:hypothetical protein
VERTLLSAAFALAVVLDFGSIPQSEKDEQELKTPGKDTTSSPRRTWNRERTRLKVRAGCAIGKGATSSRAASARQRGTEKLAHVSPRNFVTNTPLVGWCMLLC